MTRLLSVALAFGIGVATLAAAHEARAQVVYQTYYAPAPVTTYYAPTTTYYAPATTAYYAAPVTSYYAPAVTTAYYAPAPVTTYYAPTTAYYAPATTVAVGYPVYYGRVRYYVPGEPVRNFFRAW